MSRCDLSLRLFRLYSGTSDPMPGVFFFFSLSSNSSNLLTFILCLVLYLPYISDADDQTGRHIEVRPTGANRQLGQDVQAVVADRVRRGRGRRILRMVPQEEDRHCPPAARMGLPRGNSAWRGTTVPNRGVEEA